MTKSLLTLIVLITFVLGFIIGAGFDDLVYKEEKLKLNLYCEGEHVIPTYWFLRETNYGYTLKTQ